MTDSQILTIALATAPTILTVLIGILINSARIADLRTYMDGRFSDLHSYIDLRFNDFDHRLDEMKDMSRRIATSR